MAEHLTELEAQVHQLLRIYAPEPLSSVEMGRYLGVSRDRVKHTIQRLIKRGLIKDKGPVIPHSRASKHRYVAVGDVTYDYPLGDPVDPEWNVSRRKPPRKHPDTLSHYEAAAYYVVKKHHQLHPNSWGLTAYGVSAALKISYTHAAQTLKKLSDKGHVRREQHRSPSSGQLRYYYKPALKPKAYDLRWFERHLKKIHDFPVEVEAFVIEQFRAANNYRSEMRRAYKDGNRRAAAKARDKANHHVKTAKIAYGVPMKRRKKYPPAAKYPASSVYNLHPRALGFAGSAAITVNARQLDAIRHILRRIAEDPEVRRYFCDQATGHAEWHHHPFFSCGYPAPKLPAIPQLPVISLSRKREITKPNTFHRSLADNGPSSVITRDAADTTERQDKNREVLDKGIGKLFHEKGWIAIPWGAVKGNPRSVTCTFKRGPVSSPAAAFIARWRLEHPKEDYACPFASLLVHGKVGYIPLHCPLRYGRAGLLSCRAFGGDCRWCYRARRLFELRKRKVKAARLSPNEDWFDQGYKLYHEGYTAYYDPSPRHPWTSREAKKYTRWLVSRDISRYEYNDITFWRSLGLSHVPRGIREAAAEHERYLQQLEEVRQRTEERAERRKNAEYWKRVEREEAERGAKARMLARPESRAERSGDVMPKDLFDEIARRAREDSREWLEQMEQAIEGRPAPPKPVISPLAARLQAVFGAKRRQDAEDQEAGEVRFNIGEADQNLVEDHVGVAIENEDAFVDDEAARIAEEIVAELEAEQEDV